MAGRDRPRDRRARRRGRGARLAARQALALALIPLLAPDGDAGDREVRALYREAEALIVAGEVDAAALRLGSALAASDEVSPLLEAVVHIRLAELHRFRSRFRDALGQLEAAGPLLGAGADDDRYRAHVRAIRAQVFLDWGLLDQAAFLLDEQRAVVRRLDDAGHEVTVERLVALHVGANLALAREDYDALERLVTDSLADDELLGGHPAERAKLRARLALGLHEQARSAPSRRSDARRTLEELLADPDLPDTERTRPRLALAELAIRDRRFEDARALLDATPPNAPDATRHEVLRATLRARLALDRGVEGAALAAERAALDAAFERFLSRWRARDPRPGGYGILQYGDAPAMLSERIRFALRTPGPDGVDAALGVVLRAQSLGSLALDAPPDDDVGLETIRAALLDDSADRGILLYLPAPERSHLFLLDAVRRLHFVLAPGDVLLAPQRRLAPWLGRPAAVGDDRKSGALVDLAAQLLPPEVRAAMNGWRGVTVVGLDLLEGAPFEALPLGDERFVGAALAVDSVPSLPFAVALARRAEDARSQRAGALLVTSPSVAGREVPPLSLGLDEARGVVAGWGDAASVLSGDDATPEAAFSPAIDSAAALQLLTHGTLDLRRERPARLVLTAGPDDDGEVDAAEIERLLAGRDAPPLVVLTACRSAAGPPRRGDAGVADLAGTLLRSGVSAVVASTHDLEQNAVLRLSAVLHRELADGVAPAEALRRARVELLEDERFRDPFHHAHLRVIGLGHRPIVPPPRRPVLHLAAAVTALGVLLTLAWAGRRRRRRPATTGDCRY